MFTPEPFWPHEGPLVQSCFTGQFPGSLHFSMASTRVSVFSVYFRTASDADGEVEQMYDVLNLLVNVVRLGTYRSWAEISMLALGR